MTKTPVLTAAVHDTPLGPFTIVVDGDGTVHASEFADHNFLANGARLAKDVGAASKALHRYFDGDGDAFSALAVTQPGSAHFQKIWGQLRRVHSGVVATYGDLAADAGLPRAARVAGNACARNAIPLIIPCHRVVPASGGIGNYGCGVDKKRWLLDFEAKGKS